MLNVYIDEWMTGKPFSSIYIELNLCLESVKLAEWCLLLNHNLLTIYKMY